AYFNDHDLQLFSKNAGIAGEVFNPSSRTVSEYLAVVNANIAGGKSDAFMTQHIDFKSTIDETGRISNNLTLTRKNTGQDQKEWWYHATNKDFLQIYTTVGSQVTASNGRSLWPKYPKRAYGPSYQIDPDVDNIESTDFYVKDLGLDRFIAFDKTVSSAWLDTPVCKTKTFTLNYQNPRK